MQRLSLPPMYLIRQALDSGEVEDVYTAVFQALEAENLSGIVTPGMRVAVTAGSRGIHCIAEVLRATVDWLRGQGADPFLVPAMGSHGRGSAEGQLAVLAGLGITKDTVGAPVRPCATTCVVGQVQGLSVHCSDRAREADGVVVVNRVRPHTSYAGPYESGLVKMLAVGLGLNPGASAVHARGVQGLVRLVPQMARVTLRELPVLFGIALLENGFHRLKRIEVIPAGRIMDREPGLLEEARALRASLPFDQAHVLVVDRIGKDLSGTGMDTKVVGRLYIAGEPEPESPRIRRIAVLRLSKGGGGSAYGIGLADVTTEAVQRATDPVATRANALASTFVERARMPAVFPSDREAVFAAVSTCGHPDPETLRLVRIRDTLHLSELWVSNALLGSLSHNVNVLEGPVDWVFDEQGNLRTEADP